MGSDSARPQADFAGARNDSGAILELANLDCTRSASSAINAAAVKRRFKLREEATRHECLSADEGASAVFSLYRPIRVVTADLEWH